MNLILTSDFPSTANAAVVERIKAAAPAPRIAWIPPFTDRDGAQFLPRAYHPKCLDCHISSPFFSGEWLVVSGEYNPLATRRSPLPPAHYQRHRLAATQA
jgi:hypothetical protein